MIHEIGAFLLFPVFALGYVLGFMFEILAFGFKHGRKGLD